MCAAESLQLKHLKLGKYIMPENNCGKTVSHFSIYMCRLNTKPVSVFGFT